MKPEGIRELLRRKFIALTVSCAPDRRIEEPVYPSEKEQR